MDSITIVSISLCGLISVVIITTTVSIWLSNLIIIAAVYLCSLLIADLYLYPYYQRPQTRIGLWMAIIIVIIGWQVSAGRISDYINVLHYIVHYAVNVLYYTIWGRILQVWEWVLLQYLTFVNHLVSQLLSLVNPSVSSLLDRIVSGWREDHRIVSRWIAELPSTNSLDPYWYLSPFE